MQINEHAIQAISSQDDSYHQSVAMWVMYTNGASCVNVIGRVAWDQYGMLLTK